MLNVTITLCKQKANDNEAFSGDTMHLPKNNINTFANTHPEVHFAVEPEVIYKILDLLQQNNRLQNPPKLQGKQRNIQPPYAQQHMLTLKEKQVLQLLAKGYSYKMIASELNKSVETIRVQLKKIYKKLQVNSNTGAIIKFQSLSGQGYFNAI